MRALRRGAVAMTAVAALTLTTGCGAQSTDAPVELTFWSWVPGIGDAVDLWNSENPDVQVNLEEVPAGSAGSYARMHSALRAATGAPDLAQIEYQELPGFVLEGGLTDLAEYGMDERGADFIDWQLEQVTFGDRVYAVPQASGPMGLYYREDVFEELGLDVPTTWDEYAEAARVIHEADPDDYISTFPPGNSAWFTALAWQAGGQWFSLEDDGSWRIAIDSPETIRVAEYWDQLVAEGVVATMPDFSNGWYSALQSGQIAAWPSAQWGGALLQGNAPDTEGLWRAAPLPQWQEGETVSANWGGSTTAVLAGSDHPQEAADFAYWLNTDPESIDILIEGGYGWPAAVGGVEGSALDQDEPFFGGQNTSEEVFAEADASIDVEWGWIPTTAAVYGHLNDGFAAAVAGNGTFVDAVRAAQTATVADMEAKGLEVSDAE